MGANFVPRNGLTPNSAGTMCPKMNKVFNISILKFIRIFDKIFVTTYPSNEFQEDYNSSGAVVCHLCVGCGTATYDEY